MISFAVTKGDRLLIKDIARRAYSIDKDRPLENIVMDITATHTNGNPIDLERLLIAPPVDFGHDIYGIGRYLDRKTGRLMEHFSPRCSMPEKHKTKKPL